MVSSNTIRFLHRDFFSLPQQAIKGKLYGICPVATDSQWSKESSICFLELVADKILSARLISNLSHVSDFWLIEKNIKHKSCFKATPVEMILKNKTNNSSISINEMLVNEACANNSEKLIEKQNAGIKKKPLKPKELAELLKQIQTIG